MQPSLKTIRALPKAELHSHIDGTVPLRELLTIARRNGRALTTRKGRKIESVSEFLGHIRGEGYHTLLDNTSSVSLLLPD